MRASKREQTSVNRFGRGAFVLLALASVAAVGVDTLAAEALERFTATTAAMKPSGTELRIDVREWSDDGGRTAVIEALADDANAAKTLAALPTKGYVWPSGGGVGYAVKYAHRVATQDGERVTFVTDKLLGAYDRAPWTADGPASPRELGYSVIELYIDRGGSGTGSVSLAAGVEVDAANGLVTLAANAPRVLANVKRTASATAN
jgi:hypothetical protein